MTRVGSLCTWLTKAEHAQILRHNLFKKCCSYLMLSATKGKQKSKIDIKVSALGRFLDQSVVHLIPLRCHLPLPDKSSVPAEGSARRPRLGTGRSMPSSGYASEMDNPALIHLIPAVVLNKKEVLFGNLSEIYEFHNRIFLKELENCIEKPELLGRCFLKRKEDLQIYEKYCQNKPKSEALWRQCGDSLFFQECQRKLDHKLSLDAYLLKPGDVAELGKLLLQGSFNIWTDHKKGHNKVKDLARFKPMQRHLFLYAKILLFCKKREENTDGHEKSPSYSFKNSLKMSTVGITENVKGDSKKFEIWYNGREEVYIIQNYDIAKYGRKSMSLCENKSEFSSLETSNNRNVSPSTRKKRADSSTSLNLERSALARKRFTLQGLSNRRALPKGKTPPHLSPFHSSICHPPSLLRLHSHTI
ncbi:hypothetical protein L345_15204, partial [Ophiophagus hannah]